MTPFPSNIDVTARESGGYAVRVSATRETE
jgi:hypothetical protein